MLTLPRFVIGGAFALTPNRQRLVGFPLVASAFRAVENVSMMREADIPFFVQAVIDTGC
jgi:hypothetical protein